MISLIYNILYTLYCIPYTTTAYKYYYYYYQYHYYCYYNYYHYHYYYYYYYYYWSDKWRRRIPKLSGMVYVKTLILIFNLNKEKRTPADLSS